MEKLIVLDYANAIVDIYDVDSVANINESYIRNLGYDTDSCSWMFGKNMEITYHKEILK